MEFLAEETVRSLLTYEELIPAVERALLSLSAGRIQQPLRNILWVPQHNGVFAQMPAVDGDLMGVKLVTFYQGNRTLPTHQATIHLFSATTGEPLVAMDGRLITEMRTAAVSAVATRCLAREDARVLAILGSGVQARSHLEALRRVRRFEEIRVWSRTAENARRFAGEFGLRVSPTAEAAVHRADVVVSVTATPDPLVRGAWLADRSLVCAVGAVGPHKRELDDAALCADVVVESHEAAMKESGDLIGAGVTPAAELGEVLAGAALPGRGRWTIFKSLGVAAEDLAAAKIVWDRWQENRRVRTAHLP
jgi:ornithine cyclodeaminase/alanine dehydrogenase-like protein (mu-crystallin family)